MLKLYIGTQRESTVGNQCFGHRWRKTENMEWDDFVKAAVTLSDSW